MKVIDVLNHNDLPRLECEILAAEALGKPRTWLLAHQNDEISAEQYTHITQCVERRMKAEPIAYIIGKKEFYGRQFLVNPNVLIPRPATEGLIDSALKFLSSKSEELREIDTGIVAFSHKFQDTSPKIIVDIGTGSGCIGITLSFETALRVIASDTSQKALAVAERNALLLHANRVEFRLGSLLDPLIDCHIPFLVVSNPPYIPDEEELMKDVSHFEPKEALFAGADGMDILIPLVKKAKANIHCCGFVIECKETQAQNLQKIL